MKSNFIRETNPLSQIVFSALIVLVSGCTSMVVGYLAGWAVFGIGPSEMQSVFENLTIPENVDYMKFLQVVQTVGIFAIPPFVAARLISNTPFQFLQLVIRPTIHRLFLAVAILIFSYNIVNWLALLNQQLVLPSFMVGIENWMKNAEEQATAITKVFLEADGISGLVGNLLMVAILPAIGEELLFRGLIQNLLKKLWRNYHIAIWVTAIFFSALHMQFFGFLPRLILGALLGYLLEWTGSLWVPILVHFLNNAAGVVLYYVTGKGLEPDEAEAAGSLFNSALFLQALIGSLFVVILMKKLYSMRAQTANYIQVEKTD